MFAGKYFQISSVPPKGDEKDLALRSSSSADFVCAAANGWQTWGDAGASASLFAGEGHLPRSRSW